MATYFVCSAAAATAAPYDTWATAAVSIPALMAGAAIAGGDIIYVHNTHNYVAGAAITWTLPETAGICRVICVDGGDAAFTAGGAAMGSTVGSISSGATENTNGNFSFTISTTVSAASMLYVHGVDVKTGAGASSSGADILLAGAAGSYFFEACNFWIDSTNIGATYTIGALNFHVAEFSDCSFQFGATGQFIGLMQGNCTFTNCRINASGSSPTSLFQQGANQRTMNLFCQACDWSLATNVINVTTFGSGFVKMNNCAIGTPETGTIAGPVTPQLEFQACDGTAGTSDILNYYFSNYAGVVQDNQSVYRSGGAQGEQYNGTDTPYSLEMQPSANASVLYPLFTPWIYVLVPSTGDKTVSMKIGHTESAVLTSADVFMEVEYMGEPGATGTQRAANSAMSINEMDDAAPVMASSISRDVVSAGTNRTDDAVDAWTGLTSEKEHTLTASINIADQGYIRCRVALTKETTSSVYVDPLITVA